MPSSDPLSSGFSLSLKGILASDQNCGEPISWRQAPSLARTLFQHFPSSAGRFLIPCCPWSQWSNSWREGHVFSLWNILAPAILFQRAVIFLAHCFISGSWNNYLLTIQLNNIIEYWMFLPYVDVKWVPTWINASMSFPTPLVNSELFNLKALLLKNNQNS